MKTLWPKRNKYREHLNKLISDSAEKQKELETFESLLLNKSTVANLQPDNGDTYPGTGENGQAASDISDCPRCHDLGKLLDETWQSSLNWDFL